MPESIPADWAAPNSLAAVLTARAAVALLPVVKSLDNMLIGIIAIRIGMLSWFSIDNADVEPDEPDEPVAVDARLLSVCGAERLCRACGVPEMSCGPDDMIVSTSVPLAVPADWSAAATWPASPLGLVVCGGVVNGVICDAVDEVPA